MSKLFRPADQRGHWSEEAVLLLLSAFWTVTAQGAFLSGALQDRPWSDPGAWGLAAALLVGLTAIHFLLLGAVAHRWLFKPVLGLMILVTALSVYYIHNYKVYLDPSMMRNVLRTDPHEARELLGVSLLPTLLLLGGLPLLVLWKLKIRRRRWGPALAVRLGSLALALAVLVGAIVSVYQPLSSLMRNRTELRYLITPANVVWSVGSVAGMDARTAVGPRKPIGEDAAPGPGWASRSKPSVLVLVVGETARAANWGLSGYARQTTPQLAELPVINFAHVTSCGTNTETSLPCMFAPVGRRNYDEARIRGSQSLLHVLARAGVGVQWVDNQSGCKGVCDGLPNVNVVDLAPPGLCQGGRCFDMGLLHGLAERLKAAQGPQLVVLHQLGNHGPSYFRRVPPEFVRFTPTCQSDDLHKCKREEIVNAYDNALLYTDHVLAALVRELQGLAGSLDAAMLYVSDHGESLGENNLYLHGIPYAIAPEVQTRVPMVLWMSDGFAEGLGLDRACVAARAAKPAAHDHLFHTVLSLLDVSTRLHEPAWDLTTGCRRAGGAPAPGMQAPSAPAAPAAPQPTSPR